MVAAAAMMNSGDTWTLRHKIFLNYKLFLVFLTVYMCLYPNKWHTIPIFIQVNGLFRFSVEIDFWIHQKMSRTNFNTSALCPNRTRDNHSILFMTFEVLSKHITQWNVQHTTTRCQIVLAVKYANVYCKQSVDILKFKYEPHYNTNNVQYFNYFSAKMSFCCVSKISRGKEHTIHILLQVAI